MGGLVVQPDQGSLNDLAVRLQRARQQPMPPEVAASVGLPAQPADLSVVPSKSAPIVFGPHGQVTGPVPPKGTLEGNKVERTRLANSGAGVDQISSRIQDTAFGQAHPLGAKVLGGLAQGVAKLGDVGLSAIAPTLAINLPGTEYHHMMLEHQLNKQIAGQEEGQQREAQAGLENVQAQQMPVTAARQQQQLAADLAEHGLKLSEDGRVVPQAPEEWSPGYKTEQDLKQAQIYGLQNPWAKAPENEPLRNADQIQQTLDDLYKSANPKGGEVPPEFKLPPNPTKGDYQRLSTMLEHLNTQNMTQAQRDESNELRREMMAIAAGNREQKTDATTKTAAYKAFTPSLDSAERFNVMAKNYEDAIKNHDQQAMLSLLANHLGMTMGLQKGSRLTRDIIREAQESRPWLQGIQAKFDKDGYLAGVTLTPEQMRQMVDLGRGRFSEDTVKARSQARYLGSQDDGPDRVPNQSTMRFYLGQTNGDVTQAKQLAAEDGWTVK